jgi:hypothetical protein
MCGLPVSVRAASAQRPRRTLLTGKQLEYHLAMALNYAWENLYKAVHYAMQSEETLQERLVGCYVIFHVLDQHGHLPPDLQKRFDTMIAAWTREPDPGGGEGTVAATVRQMDELEARKWLEEILSLFIKVAELETRSTPAE